MERVKAEAFAAVDARLPEFKQLLGDAIRIPTDNPPGDTSACAAMLADHLRGRGLPDVQLHEPAPGVVSLVASVGAAAESAWSNVVMNGHLDQFPAGLPGGWSHDPYAGDEVDGKIRGRGVGDMKAGSIISLLVLQLAHELALPLRPGRRLTLTLVADEESGGQLGTQWLLDNVPGTRGTCSLNSEPTKVGEQQRILIGHKGFYRLRVVASRAIGGHAAVPVEDGAITVAQCAAQAVYDAVHEWAPPPPPELAAVVARAKVESADPANTETQGQDYLMDHATVSVGTIHGGSASNTIAQQCEIELDVRTPIGATTVALQAKAAEAVRLATARFEPMTAVELDWAGALEAALAVGGKVNSTHPCIFSIQNP
jgi:succinyl-diaminopimelate desuccinylase